jgi:hypothetical protein
VNILNVELFQRKYFNRSQFFLYGFQPTHKPAQGCQDQIRHFQNFQKFFQIKHISRISQYQKWPNIDLNISPSSF